MRNIFIWFVTFFLLVLATPSFSAVPNIITHQGYLTGSSGSAFSGPTQMTFALYTVDTGGTAIWIETQTAQVNNGVFAVALGSVTPLAPVQINGDLWLGVTVGADAEMTPRQKLNSVAFAIQANKADSVADASITESSLNASLLQKINDLQQENSTMQLRLRGDDSVMVDNGDGTVTDLATGLMWETTPFSTPTYWHVASGTYDATYNPTAINQCMERAPVPYPNWRLPTAMELEGLINRNLYTTNTSPKLNISTNYYYWSSSKIWNSNIVPVMRFGVNVGISTSGILGAQNYSLCVRDTN